MKRGSNFSNLMRVIRLTAFVLSRMVITAGSPSSIAERGTIKNIKSKRRRKCFSKSWGMSPPFKKFCSPDLHEPYAGLFSVYDKGNLISTMMSLWGGRISPLSAGLESRYK
jgi:hypothetical protein